MYFDPDLNPQTIAAVRQAFVRALRHVPAWAMHRAFDTWEKSMTRRPSPAEIVILAEKELKPLTDELRRRDEVSETKTLAPAERQRVTPEAAARIMAEFGYGRPADRQEVRDHLVSDWKHPLDGLAEDDPQRVALREARARAFKRMS